MPRRLFFLILLAFLLRLALGALAFVALPQIGYDSKPQQAGYLFYDAYNRDHEAWSLAKSDRSLLAAFSGQYPSDQYGGLLFLSAAVYRLLGSHQPLWMVLVAALAGALGGIFVYHAASRFLDEKTTWLATLIFLFFPEAIFLGAAQMREPFLMTFVAMAFYGLVNWQAGHGKSAWPWLALALAGMLAFSPGIALLTLVAAAGWVYFGNQGNKIPWQGLAIGAGVFVLGLVILSLSWDNLVTARSGPLGVIGDWARETAKWNRHVLESSSGIVQLMFEALPAGLVMPFVTVYGILQPVLPAVVIEPGLPFWQVLGTLRALGWYALLPFVAYAPFAAWKMPTGQRQKQMAWLALLVWVWIIIAAVRGGGDQWDNPRYRVIPMIFLAVSAAQAYYALKSRWFGRILVVEAIILLVFTHWYSFRYLKIGFNLGIRNTLMLALGSAILLVGGDWLREKIRARKN